MKSKVNLELENAAKRLFHKDYQINGIVHSVDNDEQKKALIDFLNNSKEGIKFSNVLEKAIELVYL